MINNDNNNSTNNLSTSTIGSTDYSRDENTRNEITIAAAATDAATDADVTAINETASPKRKKKTKTKKKKQDLEEGCTSPPSSSTPTPSSSRFITSRSSRTKLISPISLPTPLSLNNDNAIDGIDDDDNEKTTKEEQNSATTTNDNNNNNTTTTATKYWTDTDVLHHGLETNQIPGYTRALSYQFGQMRLMIYYKSKSKSTSSDPEDNNDTNDDNDNDNDNIIKSFDLLKVNYRATGKAGLANKGGIVAEVAIHKTARLSFFTVHLEAHEGEKQYEAQNESCMDISDGYCYYYNFK